MTWHVGKSFLSLFGRAETANECVVCVGCSCMWGLALVLAVGWIMDTDSTYFWMCAVCIVYLFGCQGWLCFDEKAHKKIDKQIKLHLKQQCYKRPSWCLMGPARRNGLKTFVSRVRAVGNNVSCPPQGPGGEQVMEGRQIAPNRPLSRADGVSSSGCRHWWRSGGWYQRRRCRSALFWSLAGWTSSATDWK